jgi:hypothetical protein
MKTLGMTHGQFDFDGGSCLKVLQKLGMIDGCLFGDEQLRAALEGEMFDQVGRFDKIIFVDASPKQSIEGGKIEVCIYDHHQTENTKGSDETALDILMKVIKPDVFNEERMVKWRQLVTAGDHKSEPDDMDIARALKRVHGLFESDSKTYNAWFSPLFEGFFGNKPDFNRALRILQEEISLFLKTNPETPAKIFLLKWQERIKNGDKIVKSTARNIVHWLAYLEENVAREWAQIFLLACDNEQKDFQECKAAFKKTRVEFFGNSLVVSAITKSPMFVKVAKSVIFSDDQDVHPLIIEKITNRNSLWIILVVNPLTKNFQIFINGSQKSLHPIIEEVTKVIRAEILQKRGFLIPSAEILVEGGTLENTRPLFFHRLVGGYPSLLWGSLKHQAPPAVEFGATASQIHSKLIELIKLALDENEFAAFCNPASCEKCPIFSWQLKKCQKKRVV